MPIQCEIVTQERLVFSDQVDMVIVDGSEGQMGILPNHAPLLTTVKISELRIRKGQEQESFVVGGGVLEVRPDRVTVLADVAEYSAEIDLARAEVARDRAERYLAEGPQARVSVEAQPEITQALLRARVRLRVGRKYREWLGSMEMGDRQ